MPLAGRVGWLRQRGPAYAGILGYNGVTTRARRVVGRNANGRKSLKGSAKSNVVEEYSPCRCSSPTVKGHSTRSVGP